MPVARSLRRLLFVLKAEEEQAQASLESALAQPRLLQNAVDSAMARERVGRQLVLMSAASGDAVDRLAALEEIASAKRTAAVLQSRIAQATREAAMQREAFLAKRIEQKQVETLVSESEAREALQATRRSQQSMDEWYLGRMVRRADPVK
jgi:flagellar biosynthesis chaperone FliJ